MRTARNRENRGKRLNPYTKAGIIIFCLVLCGTVAYKTITLREQSSAYDKQIEQLKEQRSDLKEEQQEIKEFKKRVNTDSYVEEVAREKLGLVHEGEIIFRPEEK
ncbi:MAG: septum formation initiator family protein [Lachnospiraceae bacterium]|nr:septum formation initiator family protein [Lachnospiraceae bacterium]